MNVDINSRHYKMAEKYMDYDGIYAQRQWGETENLCPYWRVVTLAAMKMVGIWSGVGAVIGYALIAVTCYVTYGHITGEWNPKVIADASVGGAVWDYVSLWYFFGIVFPTFLAGGLVFIIAPVLLFIVAVLFVLVLVGTTLERGWLSFRKVSKGTAGNLMERLREAESTGETVGLWEAKMHSLHEKICPEITFVDSEKEENKEND